MELKDTFWREPTLDQLALEQNVKPIERFEEVFGRAANLWESEDDFESFLAATKGCCKKKK